MRARGRRRPKSDKGQNLTLFNDKVAKIYTKAVSCEHTERGSVRLLAWMFDRMGGPVPPREVNLAMALEFAEWLTLPESAIRVRYASIWMVDTRLAVLYKALAESTRAASSSADVLRHVTDADRRIIGTDQQAGAELRRLSSQFSRWVRRTNDGKFAIRPGGGTPSSASTYCAWNGMLWVNLIKHGHADTNPWWKARASVATDPSEQPSKIDDQTVDAVRKIVATFGDAKLTTARDAWLLCAGGLLALSAVEIGSAKRSDLRGSVGTGMLRVVVPARTYAMDVVVGPAAASWLHRFEGALARSSKPDGDDRSSLLLASAAPLWPSLAKWGASETRQITHFMGGRSVSKAIRAMDPAGIVNLRSLRRIHELALGCNRATARKLVAMASRRPEDLEGASAGRADRMSTAVDDRLRIAAQATLAEMFGIGCA